jgi:hypothetical protein
MSGLDGKGSRLPGGVNVPVGKLFIADTAITATAAQLNTANRFITHIPVENLAAGANIATRAVFSVPTGLTLTLDSIDILPQGDDAGIDAGNTCVIAVANGANAIVTKTYDGTTGKVFPDDATVGNLGALSAAYKALAAGAVVKLSVTNGATADPPAFLLRLTGTLATA